MAEIKLTYQDRSVELRRQDGNSTRVPMRWLIPCESTAWDNGFPAIIVQDERAYYNIGTREKGRMAIYEECTTAVLKSKEAHRMPLANQPKQNYLRVRVTEHQHPNQYRAYSYVADDNMTHTTPPMKHEGAKRLMIEWLKRITGVGRVSLVVTEVVKGA